MATRHESESCIEIFRRPSLSPSRLVTPIRIHPLLRVSFSQLYFLQQLKIRVTKMDESDTESSGCSDALEGDKLVIGLDFGTTFSGSVTCPILVLTS